MESNKVNPGALAQAQSLFSKFNALTTPANIYQVPGQNSAAGDNSYFPASIGSTDPEDQKYMLRQQLVSNGVVNNIGTPVIGDEFFNYAKRKQDQAMLYDFQTWVMKQADMTKPESAAWWFEKFPWMKDLRLDQINREAEVQKRLATISITGPQSQEDFMVLFMQKQGLLKPANVPLYMMGNAGAGGIASTGEGAFARGVFNPLTPAYPQTMATSIVPYSNPVNGAWGGGAQNSPYPVGGGGLNGGNFNIGGLLGQGGVFGAPAAAAVPPAP